MKFKFVFLTLLLTSLQLSGQKAELIVEVTTPGDKGQVIVRLFRLQDDYPKTYYQQKIVKPEDHKVLAVFDNLKYGYYALAIIHDENGNGKLDFYWFGPPKESVLASNYAKGFMGPPYFEEAKFELKGAVKKIFLDFNKK